MEGVKLLNVLDQKREEFLSQETTINTLVNELEFYEAFIPAFFSPDGEAERIHRMFRDIYEVSNDTIKCIDIGNASNIYLEYVDGMTEFIKDVTKECYNNESIPSYETKEKYEKAKEKDILFVNSLFTESAISEVNEIPLHDAVGHVEYLIDFIPQMKSLKETCKNLYESSNPLESAGFVNDCLTMLYESVGNYAYSTLKNILTTYEDIQNTIDNKSNDEDDEFKLF